MLKASDTRGVEGSGTPPPLVGTRRVEGSGTPTPLVGTRGVERCPSLGMLPSGPEEDEAAVQQLAALGFAREQAAEAYLACDRNQTLAANFLMDQF